MRRPHSSIGSGASFELQHRGEAESARYRVHHHEYLDGSGYPHGLSASELSDFVRIGTVCDVFGALLERRAYKAPIRGDIPFQMLVEMGPKLDKLRSRIGENGKVV